MKIQRIEGKVTIESLSQHIRDLGQSRRTSQTIINRGNPSIIYQDRSQILRFA